MQLLIEHRPVVAEPKPEVTRRARHALLVHMDADDASAGVTASGEHSHKRRRRYPVIAVAAAIIVAVIVGVAPGRGPGRTEAASALDRLAAVAQNHRAAGAGTVVHTVSVAEWGPGLVTRETWIAPDGSGRIHETGQGAAFGDTRFGPGGLYYVDFSDWPSSASGVLSKLRAEARKADMRPIDAEAFVRAGDYLRESGAPSDVRAAIFGAVSRLHGVRSLGAVTDHDGREGVGFEIYSDTDHDSRWQLIFDPATSELLGERQGSISHGYDTWSVYRVTELVTEVPPGGQLTNGGPVPLPAD